MLSVRHRIWWEIVLALAALVIAAVVIVPVLWLANVVFHANKDGDYWLLAVVVIAGVLILIYQARFRPAAR